MAHTRAKVKVKALVGEVPEVFVKKEVGRLEWGRRKSAGIYIRRRRWSGSREWARIVSLLLITSADQ